MMDAPPWFTEGFAEGVGARWKQHQVGSGSLEATGATLRLVNADTAASRYSNAQIDDYVGLPRRRFLWRPPLTLGVRARFSHPGPVPARDSDCDYRYYPVEGKASSGGVGAAGGEHGDRGILSGTAGFGFWNDPFLMTEPRLPALPKALWFFYGSPPSNMKLDLSTPGCGWKAATIDAARLPFLLLAPTAPVAIPLMRLRRAYRLLWPLAQRAIQVSEAPVDADMTAWHEYALEWERAEAVFHVDGREVLRVPRPPAVPLGFVAWMDNQVAVARPDGEFRFGLEAVPDWQWLELGLVEIEEP